MSKNTNCLDGMRCPKCGHEDDFKMTVTVTAAVYMTDDGYDFNEADNVHTDWEDEDWMLCMGCNFDGTVEDFYIVNQKKEN